MSARRSSGWFCSCSGDMYSNFPFTKPLSVRVSRSAALAMPKSRTFTVPS